MSMRQKQQFDDKGADNRLDKFKIQAPLSQTSYNRFQRSQSLNNKSNNHPTHPPAQQPHSHNKSIYEETYYISNTRDNYLVLISDNMQILELPLGLIRQDIKIGYPIKLKLEYDVKRQQVDENRFKTIQKELYKEFKEKGNH